MSSSLSSGRSYDNDNDVCDDDNDDYDIFYTILLLNPVGADGDISVFSTIETFHRIFPGSSIYSTYESR